MASPSPKTFLRFLADKLDLAPSEVEIVKGHSSKTKIVDVPMVIDDIVTALS